MTFLPKIHGPVSTINQLAPVSLLALSTLPMPPSRASIEHQVRSRRAAASSGYPHIPRSALPVLVVLTTITCLFHFVCVTARFNSGMPACPAHTEPRCGHRLAVGGARISRLPCPVDSVQVDTSHSTRTAQQTAIRVLTGPTINLRVRTRTSEVRACCWPVSGPTSRWMPSRTHRTLQAKDVKAAEPCRRGGSR
jgi:hypothetical protein